MTLEEKLHQAADMIIACFQKGGKLLLCGNGGSAADCDHIAGELLKGFLLKRPLDQTLRKKLETLPDSPEFIQTHVGIGYRMLKVENIAGAFS